MKTIPLLLALLTVPLGAQSLLETDWSLGTAAWRASGGKWSAADGELLSVGSGKFLAGSIRWKDYRVSARLRTDEAGKETWNTATLFFRHADDENHYMVLLHTGGKLELVRTRAGARKPNFASADLKLDAGTWHEVLVEVRGGKIEIRVDGRPALEAIDPDPIPRGGVALGNNNAKQCRFGRVSVVPLGGESAGAAAEAARTVAIYRQPGLDTTALEKSLEKSGLKVVGLRTDEAILGGALDPEKFSLYIVPGCETYPADGWDPLMTWVQLGGKLIFTGGPAFSKTTYRVPVHGADAWVDQAGLEAALSKTPTRRVLLDFEKELDWKRSTDDEAGGAAVKGADGGIKGRCLAYEVAKLGGWATFYTALEGGLSAEDNALCLWAKGDASTPRLMLELVEKDGSRWLCPASIGTEWTYLVIPLRRFSFWHDSPTRGKRGGAGDGLNAADLARFNIGLVAGPLNLAPGRHRFWIDEVGSAKGPLSEKVQRQMLSKPPVLEGMSPSYKVYPLTGIKTLQAADVPWLDLGALPSPPIGMLSCYPRPKGQGFTGANLFRWIPLVTALDRDGEERGAAAWLMLNAGSPNPGAACAMITTPWSDELTQKLILAATKRMQRGLFLFEAGADRFSYDPGAPAELGAWIQNGSALEAQALVRFTVEAAGKTLFQKEIPVRIPRDGVGRASAPWIPGAPAFRVKTELLVDGKSIDAIAHDGALLAAKRAAPGDFVTVERGDFWCAGKKWYPHGMNYWPRDAAALEPGPYNEGWLSPGAYCPEVVERDLSQMKGMGINLVSIQMGGLRQIPNLRDFMRRCAAHGLKVNGFLSGANPTDFDERLATNLIAQARLADDPALFAYDISWEAGNHVFHPKNRKRWDGAWNQWIVERYGSADAARRDWRYGALGDGQTVRSPQDRELAEAGEWRAYSAAYRRFMDDLTSRLWNDAHRALRRADPKHLISFRQGNTLPYDFGLTGAVKHVDFISPEGYTIKNDPDGYDVAGFITRYVRHTTGDKPVYWAEFGRSVWNETAMAPDEESVRIQGQYNELFYRMVMEAGANGLSPWWWPGGYRVNEKSDFGVLHPDGRPRPAAQVLRDWAERITGPRERKAPDEWLTVDRDAHPGGYWYFCFHEGKDAWRKARLAGKTLGVRSAGTGTDSANTPLVAVGNLPLNGANPPKYLNAEFNRISILSATGEWVEVVKSGARVVVAPDKPVRAKASIGNLGEAAWLAPARQPGKGGVYLSARTGGILFRAPILRDVPSLGDGETGEFTLTPGIAKDTPLVLEMTALDRAWFGEKWNVTLGVPKESGK
ncbi:MAG: beta-galactosidase [Spirochaetes bacterium]|nr:beta-galactosidase [Spirochaetota bacterium]